MATVIIRKRLTPTDIKSCLSYPARTLWAFPMVEGQTAIWFQARDPTGKVWNFELSKRPHGYLKPVIRGDWLNYVREKGLTVRDVIVLTREQDIQYEVTYHIKVEPDLRLTLKTFSSAYEVITLLLLFHLCFASFDLVSDPLESLQPLGCWRKQLMMAQDTWRVKDAEYK
ncbi:hypothetical protein POTOM_016585 [Populus tomentosa]|uniref:TF-B3 domain-containing protein n=1 Tax=Populus tomentosa TaxID=118781 RepID=A0A8X8D3Z4_POPTO|nr:hypothetical protein POTOM_016585 [Populus tomentosa]